jgi:2-dehydro-3-deoxygluconokinase
MIVKKAVMFGEIMLRLSTPNFMRFVQARSFDAIYAGAEANVAIALSHFKVPTDFVSRLPNNELGDACINYLRQFGVGTGRIVRGGERLGIYFVEMGAAQRGNKVLYDRANSSLATIKPDMIDWDKTFEDASWFHWSGITPAVSKEAADTCMEAVRTAKEMGLTVSCDLNYRGKLWKWGRTAGEVMSGMMKYVDIMIGNEEDTEKVFGVKAPETDVSKGKVEAHSYVPVANEIIERFSNLKYVAFTLRGSISATHNTWSGVLCDRKKAYIGPQYDIAFIVDRIGAGDTFSAGLIYGMRSYSEDLQKVVDFATAASCLKHSVYGDSAIMTKEEVEELMKGITSGRISR